MTLNSIISGWPLNGSISNRNIFRYRLISPLWNDLRQFPYSRRTNLQTTTENGNQTYSCNIIYHINNLTAIPYVSFNISIQKCWAGIHNHDINLASLDVLIRAFWSQKLERKEHDEWLPAVHRFLEKLVLQTKRCDLKGPVIAGDLKGVINYSHC